MLTWGGNMKSKPKKIQKKKQVHEEAVSSIEETTSEFIYDEVTGGRDKKPVMAVLNKKRITKWEMDELFLGEE